MQESVENKGIDQPFQIENPQITKEAETREPSSPMGQVKVSAHQKQKDRKRTTRNKPHKIPVEIKKNP